MKIKSAEYVISAATSGQFPPPYIPEVAFAGKSNVGKSSLINALLNRKSLVKTSSQPGKTRLINFFLINQVFHLVDLPGYGFAKVPLHVKAEWEKLIVSYLTDRAPLKGVVVILDIRHPPGTLDKQMKAWLDEQQLPAFYVANKVDKLKRGKILSHLNTLAKDLGLDELPLPCSASTGDGRNEIWQHLNHWMQGHAKAEKRE